MTDTMRKLDGPTASSGLRHASWGDRCSAFLLDLLLAAPLWIVAIVVAAGEGSLNEVLGWAVLVFWVYERLLDGVRGQSPGKALMGLRVVDESTGARLGRGRGLARWLLGLFFIFFFGPINYVIVPLVARRHQTLHDMLTGATVLVDPTSRRRPSPALWGWTSERSAGSARQPHVNATASQVMALSSTGHRDDGGSTSGPGTQWTMRVLGLLALAGGTVCLWIAMFLPWSPAIASLVSLPRELAYNVPTLTLSTVALVLVFGQSTKSYGAVIAFVTSLWVLAQSFTDLSETFNAAHLVLLAGAVLVLVGAVVTAREARVSLRVDLAAIGWAGGATVLSCAWVVGEWMPWTRFTYEGNTGVAFSNGSNRIDIDCCVAFRDVAAPEAARQVATMLLVVVASLLAAFVWSRLASGATLIATGLIYMSDSLLWIVGNNDSTLSPAQLVARGTSEAEAGRIQSLALHPLLGGWIATAAALLLIVLGAFRILVAIATKQSGGSGGTTARRDAADRT